MYDKNVNVRDADWTYKEIDILNKHLFFTAKSVVYLVNVSESDYINKKNKWLAKIKKWVDAHGGGQIIPYSAVFERKLSEMTAEEQQKILTEQKTTSALAKISRAGYHSLNLIHYFTAGEDEVKCWTLRAGTKAPGAAAHIRPWRGARMVVGEKTACGLAAPHPTF